MVDAKYPKRLRLRKRGEFLRVQSRGGRGRSRFFVLLWDQKRDEPTRVGITVSKKVGCAVVRNRVKRRIREWIRHYHAPLLGGDYVVIARSAANSASSADLHDELHKVFRRLHTVRE